jgi:uncharacterized membrane protein YbjE (DUF340 family)
VVVILLMAVGVLIGYRFVPLRYTEKLGKVNSWIQVVCIALLIFSMGVTLGSRENFVSELSSLGIKSVVFALIPIILSVAVVYPLTQHFLMKPKKRKDQEE